MAETRVWLMRSLYLGLCLVIIFVHLLPLDTQPRLWAPPDLLVAFTFAWALRRPEYVPVLSVAAVMLAADLLFQRPPGLYAALVLIGLEYVRRRTGALRRAGFAGEWLTVALAIAAMGLANRVVLSLLSVNLAPLGPSLIQSVLTVLFYPAAVLLTEWLAGVRRPAAGEIDMAGGRI